MVNNVYSNWYVTNTSGTADLCCQIGIQAFQYTVLEFIVSRWNLNSGKRFSKIQVRLGDI